MRPALTSPIGRSGLRDACPGAVTLHEAADGGLARVRVPGGQLAQAQWRALISASEHLGDGNLHLTSRGNVEIRGLPASSGTELGAILADAAMLPSRTHERARNVSCSPLAGLDFEGRHDVSVLVSELDTALISRPELATLSGKFFFGLDDGRGDIVALAPDLAIRAMNHECGRVVIAGQDTEIEVPWSAAVPTLIAAAVEFLRIRTVCGSAAWRIREIDTAAQAIAAYLQGRAQVRARSSADQVPAAAGTDQAAVVSPASPDAVSAADEPPSYGWLSAPDGSVSVVIGVPLGELNAQQAKAFTTPALRLTPWHSVVLTGLSYDTAIHKIAQLTELGLISDNTSPWRTVTACTGSPGCAKSHADVRADARRLHAVPTGLVHWSGCERRCGRPTVAHLDVLATPWGYEVTGAAADATSVVGYVARSTVTGTS